MHTGPRLSKEWVAKWERSGRTLLLPVWIDPSEIGQWQEFQRQHPELVEASRESLEAARKLEEGVRRSPPNRQLGVSPGVSQKTTSATASVLKALNGIRSASIRNRDPVVTALFHHLNRDMLKYAFAHLRKAAAHGCDKVIWEEYEKNLDQNIQDLWVRSINGSYQPQPVRRTYIPKASRNLHDRRQESSVRP